MNAPQGHNATTEGTGSGAATWAAGGQPIAPGGVWPIIIELGFRGIHIPTGPTYARTACPHCPPKQRISRDGRPRNGSTEKPMRVWIINPTTADVMCRGCETKERIEA